jgi:hypothetical protein
MRLAISPALLFSSVLSTFACGAANDASSASSNSAVSGDDCKPVTQLACAAGQTIKTDGCTQAEAPAAASVARGRCVAASNVHLVQDGSAIRGRFQVEERTRACFYETASSLNGEHFQIVGPGIVDVQADETGVQISWPGTTDLAMGVAEIATGDFMQVGDDSESGESGTSDASSGRYTDTGFFYTSTFFRGIPGEPNNVTTTSIVPDDDGNLTVTTTMSGQVASHDACHFKRID